MLRGKTKLFVFLSYVLIYTAAFWIIKDGIGQYWDWSFPIFREHIANYFSFRSQSWTSLNFGSPLGYSSDYFFRLALSALRSLSPERLIYALLVTLFSTASFGAFLLLSRKANYFWSYILGLACLLNPAIFYKVLAGHLNYLASYVVFIYLLYFLLARYKGSFRDSLILGLLIALVGAQIQFFIFAFIILGLYFLFYREKFKLFNLAPILGIPLLANSFWLLNFLLSSSIADISAIARTGSFSGSHSQEYINIFAFSFSRATLITYFYSAYELAYFCLFYLLLTYLYLKARQKNRKTVFLQILLLSLMFLSTGIFLSADIPPFNTLYPMLREVGHFAPLVALVSFYLLGETIMSASMRMKSLLLAYLALFIAINVYKFQTHLPVIDYDFVRSEFSDFKGFHDGSRLTDRVLFYPFFSQYSLLDMQSNIKNNFRLNNTSRDSFMTYSMDDYVNNSVLAYKVRDSLQFRLLQTYDAGILKYHNIRYIYDFSDIYESHYEKYVPKSTYNGNLSMIKTDPGFFQKLAERNPGMLKKVGDRIYEVTDTLPKVFAADKIAEFQSGNMENSVNSLATDPGKPLLFVPGGKSGDFGAITVKIYSLFNGLSGSNIDIANKAINYEVDLTGKENSTIAFSANNNPAESEGSNTGRLLLNGSPVDGASVPDRVINGAVNTFSYIDEAYSFENVVPNPAFETGLWSNAVDDCNNYDNDPSLDMSLNSGEKSGGANSLQLEATRHIACTSTVMPVRGGASYLFSFDYQSPNSEYAGYYFDFNDSNRSSVNETLAVRGKGWQNFSKTIDIPAGATQARLFVYAYESDRKNNNTVRYDNFTLMEIPDLENRFFLLSKPNTGFAVPKAVDTEDVSPSKRIVRIRGATAPFFLAASESYNSKWQLLFNNDKLRGALSGWSPLAKSDKITQDNHIMINNFMNGWFIDTGSLCQDGALCRKNADGSYDLEMIMEFQPQRFFNVTLMLSGATLLGCAIYLLVSRKNKPISNNLKRLPNGR